MGSQDATEARKKAGDRPCDGEHHTAERGMLCLPCISVVISSRIHGLTPIACIAWILRRVSVRLCLVAACFPFSAWYSGASCVELSRTVLVREPVRRCTNMGVTACVARQPSRSRGLTHVTCSMRGGSHVAVTKSSRSRNSGRSGRRRKRRVGRCRTICNSWHFLNHRCSMISWSLACRVRSTRCKGTGSIAQRVRAVGLLVDCMSRMTLYARFRLHTKKSE